jgi:hydroxymethylpyrimidine kinase/phosphomethylpyrimidine kinase
MKIALTIAGSDSGGGAGIQADLKTFQQFGCFGTSAIVALTAQNTRGVTGVHLVPIDFIALQLATLANDLPPAALKTGMLATTEIVETVADAVRRYGWGPLVVDPVTIATSGDRLLQPDAEAAIRTRLLPLAALVTPNLDEAALLSGRELRTVAQMADAGRALLQLGVPAALVKGGHGTGDPVTDVLVTHDGVQTWQHPRLTTKSTHGTGCTLSAAVTAGLALGHALERAVRDALDYTWRAIERAPGLGSGHGPLDHTVPVVPEA